MRGIARQWTWGLCLLALAGCNIEVEPIGASRDGGVRPAARASAMLLPPRSFDALRIASFNIQVFGESKMQKPQVVSVLIDVVRRFDVVAIQELRAADQTLIPYFVQLINADGARYDYVVGPRLGRTSSKEQYVYLFDTARVSLVPNSVYSINDPDDWLHREPLVASFQTLSTSNRPPFTFTLINMHTDPDEAEDEVNVLDDVFLSARADGRYEEDVILLGDLNVNHERLGQLGGVPGIRCTVMGEPTNTAGTKSYDNLVFDPGATSEYTGRAGVLDVQRAFRLTDEQAKEVSDHRPVWAEFSIYERRATSLAARPR
ncbi:MAG: endonuclease/exonuclease/phosphatase family protein [Planctomycetales bacterium]|nr:endonuclease/exonuclease/phosphatase family protein [Planctomycetales bacterium]